MHQGLRTLDQLPIGESAVVHRIDCDRRVGGRLMEMGLLPGTRIEMVRRAPFGDPLEIRLRGYLLSLRSADAAEVSLAPLDQVDPDAMTAQAPATVDPLRRPPAARCGPANAGPARARRRQRQLGQDDHLQRPDRLARQGRATIPASP